MMKKFNYALCHMFPFSKIPKNAPVVIWGTGNVGSQYYAELVAANYTGDIKYKLVYDNSQTLENKASLITKNSDQTLTFMLISDIHFGSIFHHKVLFF